MDILSFTLVLAILPLSSVFCAYQKKYTCEGNLDVKCAEGVIILVAINTADRYEINACPDHARRYTTPSASLKKAVWESCNGKPKCTIQTGIKSLSDYKYFDVVFDCGSGYDLCSKDIIVANSSYLRSPNDFVFRSRRKCQCEADLFEPVDLTVRLIEEQFNVTMPKLQINWLNKTERITKRVAQGMAQKFTIEFTANHQAGSGSFLLLYKADRQIVLECNQEDEVTIDIATILIAPIAMVAFLIVITIVVIVVKKVRKSKKRKAKMAGGATGTDIEQEAQSKPDLLNYGSTVADRDDIPLAKSEKETQEGGVQK